MIKSFLIFSIIAVVSIVPSRAQLGETLKQCIERYGKPTSRFNAPTGLAGDGYIFKNNSYVIMTILLSERVGLEIILKEDKTDLSNKEIEAVLGADIAGGQWDEPEHLNLPHAKESWSRKDGAMAVYEPSKHCLSLVSRLYIEATQSNINK